MMDSPPPPIVITPPSSTSSRPPLRRANSHAAHARSRSNSLRCANRVSELKQRLTITNMGFYQSPVATDNGSSSSSKTTIAAGELQIPSLREEIETNVSVAELKQLLEGSLVFSLPS